MRTIGTDTDPFRVVNREYKAHFNDIFAKPLFEEFRPKLPVMQTQYKVVTSGDNSKLEALVNMYLQEGWSLYGHLEVTFNVAMCGNTFSQAMVKEVVEN